MGGSATVRRLAMRLQLLEFLIVGDFILDVPVLTSLHLSSISFGQALQLVHQMDFRYQPVYHK